MEVLTGGREITAFLSVCTHEAHTNTGRKAVTDHLNAAPRRPTRMRSGTMLTKLPSGFFYGTVILAFAATGLLSARQEGPTTKQTRAVTEELVHVDTSDGITNGGAVFSAVPGSSSPIAVI
jgi:hypothetical protein